MLPIVKVKEAERLLAEGQLSFRKIAALVGISRATVGQIAAGKRPDYEARMAARAAAEEPPGPLGRCAECGGLVHMPCRLCRVRKMKAQQDEAGRTQRRLARQRAARQLLAAVWKASQARERALAEASHLPAGPAAGAAGASDCK